MKTSRGCDLKIPPSSSKLTTTMSMPCAGAASSGGPSSSSREPPDGAELPAHVRGKKREREDADDSMDIWT